MIRRRLRICINVLYSNSRYVFKKVNSPQYSRHSYILIPEIPKKSNESNLETIIGASPYDNFIEISRSLHEFEADLNTVFEKLMLTKTEDLTFENSIAQIRSVIQKLDVKYKYLKISSLGKGDLINRIIASSLARKNGLANQEIITIPHLNRIINAVSKSDLDILESKCLDVITQNLKLYGSGLGNDKRVALHETINKLLQSQLKFSKSLYSSIQKVAQFINKNEMSEDTPQWFFDKIKSPKFENLLEINAQDSYMTSQLLKYCNNHQLRNQIWLVRRQLGGRILYDIRISNYENIDDIREYRRDIASFLGEKSYCDVLFNSNKRMVKSVEQILDVLQNYKASVLPKAEYEYKHMVEYARKEKNLIGSLLLCDYNYIHHCFSVDVKKCPWTKLEINGSSFEIHGLINRTCGVLEKFFNVSFSEASNTLETITYSVYNSLTKEHLGNIVFLLNKSSGSNVYVVPIKTDESLPVSYVVIHYYSEQPNILEGLNIVAGIGKAFEKIYQNINLEVENSPIFHIHQPDSVQIVSKFFLSCVMSSKSVFKHVFNEIDSKLAEDLIDTYSSKSSIYLNEVEVIEKLSRAYYDLEIWLSKRSWQDIQADIWNNFFSQQSELYFPSEKMDEWPCGAVEIFCNDLWGGAILYSDFWQGHVVKLIMNCFIKNGYITWDFNEEMNPELHSLFGKFHKTFIEDQLSCKSKSLSHFLN